MNAQSPSKHRVPKTPGWQCQNLKILNPLLLLVVGGAWTNAPAQPQPRPLACLHAHNDYEHRRPLFDALDHGFASVEADIYLVENQLLVAHNRKDVKPERTLQALYLAPLRDRVHKNGGRVYRDGPAFNLLIDIKGDWRKTYPVLRELLQRYADILTTFDRDKAQPRAITVILTGDRSREMFAGETLRYAALDGSLADLASGAPVELIPWISSDWKATFTWGGTGTITEPEKVKLDELVTQAHRQGRRVRFWGAPDQPVFWREMLAQGVDLINTDDLPGAQKFVLEQPER